METPFLAVAGFAVLYAAAAAIALRIPAGWGRGGVPARRAAALALAASALPAAGLLPLPDGWFRPTATNPIGLGRYLLAVAPIGAAVAYLAALGWDLRRAPCSPVGPTAVLSILLAGTLAAVSAATPPWDDESLRLLSAESIVRDGDLDVSNQYLDRAWRRFRVPSGALFDEVEGRVVDVLGDRPVAIRTHYATGMDLLVAAGYALPAFVDAHPYLLRLGASFPSALAAALVLPLLVRILLRWGAGPGAALAAAGAVAATPCWLFFAGRLWPEWPAALGLLYAVSLLDPAAPGPLARRAALIGLTLGALPLLHVRLAIPSLALGAVAAGALGGRGAWRAAALLVAAGVAVGSLAALDMAARRHHPPSLAIYRASAYPDVTLAEGVPVFDLGRAGLGEAWRRWVRPPSGVFLYAPWALLALPLLFRPPIPAACRWGCAAAGASLFLFLLGMYIPPTGPLARYYVALLPLLALPLPGCLEAGRPARVFLAACVGWSAAKGLVVAVAPALAFDAKVADEAYARLVGAGVPFPAAAFVWLLLA